MDNLTTSIKIIFGKCQPDIVLKNYFKSQSLPFVNHFPDSIFHLSSLDEKKNYSWDELINIKNKLEEDWFEDVYKKTKNKKSIFNLLMHFNKQVLIEIENEPFVHYENLLRWRETSFALGEDIFSTSYLAYMDNRSGRNRHFFAWRPVLFSNNIRLKGMLKQGLAENHFHLKGSAPVFDLSWLALMNSVDRKSPAFNKLKKEVKLNPNTNNSFENNQDDIEVLIYKAAYIRQIIFQKMHNLGNEEVNKNIRMPSNHEKSFEFIMGLGDLQNSIASLKSLLGFSFNHRGSKNTADYAIPKKLHQDNFDGAVLLTGERKFLYDCFKKIYANDKEFQKLQDLFYTYLLIKNKFREELIQVNKKVGFGNFLKYQDRKEDFIPVNSIYETAFLNMAVHSSLAFQNILSFETRIAPKNSANELNSILKNIEKSILPDAITSVVKMPSTKSAKNNTHRYQSDSVGKSKHETTHFHVIHFIKEKDKQLSIKSNDLVNSITARHSILREKIKVQSKAIVGLREGFSSSSDLIRGIDAAASEFDARPEVFAQAFRYLKDHKLSGRFNYVKSGIKEYRLFGTYHAGEDFYDLIDGLRTIDEAIQFLSLKQGDRIGHALALGINVNEYFNFKGRKLMLPKEVLLDNIVWLLAKIRKFGIAICRPEVNRLEKMYNNLFHEIYNSNFDSYHKSCTYSHIQFYDAWKLRGDDPYLYLNNYEKDVELRHNYNYWQRCGINLFYPKNSNIRQNQSVKFLYHEYHFNSGVKRSGKKIKQFLISDDYIKLVTEVQKCYQDSIKNLNIGIECNPTSNYLIGTFDKYSKHPIVNFYNLGLELDPEKLKNCPQLFVSINTDDQGIFGTSLENEYALMAIAMEKEKDENGKRKYNQAMIYQWLDNIRKMGLEQSFSKK